MFFRTTIWADVDGWWVALIEFVLAHIASSCESELHLGFPIHSTAVAYGLARGSLTNGWAGLKPRNGLLKYFLTALDEPYDDGRHAHGSWTNLQTPTATDRTNKRDIVGEEGVGGWKQTRRANQCEGSHPKYGRSALKFGRPQTQKLQIPQIFT